MHELNKEWHLDELVDDMKHYIYPILPDYSINYERLHEWRSIMRSLPLEDESDRLLAKFVDKFADEFRYISLEEFDYTIRYTLQMVLNEIQEPIYVYLPDIKSFKSYFWIFLLCYDILCDCPNILGIVGYKDQISAPVLYLDDAVYTGSQLIHTLQLKRKTYLVCAFIGEVAIKRLVPYVKKGMLILPRGIRIAHSILTKEEREKLDNSKYSTYIRNAMCDDVCPAWYFQHKLADYVSLPLGIINDGLAIVEVKEEVNVASAAQEQQYYFITPEKYMWFLEHRDKGYIFGFAFGLLNKPEVQAYMQGHQTPVNLEEVGIGRSSSKAKPNYKFEAEILSDVIEIKERLGDDMEITSAND